MATRPVHHTARPVPDNNTGPVCPFGMSMPRSPHLSDSLACRTNTSLAVADVVMVDPPVLMCRCSRDPRSVPAPDSGGEATTSRERVPLQPTHWLSTTFAAISPSSPGFSAIAQPPGDTVLKLGPIFKQSVEPSTQVRRCRRRVSVFRKPDPRRMQDEEPPNRHCCCHVFYRWCIG